ncbi:MAG TPA: phenylalanine 4-monooxygenase [Thermoanaerobaculia bacterium]|nr:phenylalanine 4-monooxygenase [Thermoanaerobaculia bacterium]
MLSSQARFDEASPAELLQLDADHPGFHDAVYRRRRNEIARAALDYREGDAVPEIAYTEREHEVWAEVWRHLDPLHDRYACRTYREAGGRIALSRQRIPQLAAVNATIHPLLGFRMTPVAGLVSAKSFLAKLGSDVFLSTQYMRHHSVPLYTPEPDVVHELIGHAATFADPAFVALNRAFGEAALRAQDHPDAIERIGRLYWYTLEFGVVREAGRLRVYGAGLLSSFGELGRFEGEEELHEWSVDEIADTPYDPTMYQQKLFVAPSFDAMANDVLNWLGRAR